MSRVVLPWRHGKPEPLCLTFTLKSLSHYPPEQGATVIAECGHLVVVNAELVWDVDSEALLCDLEGEEKESSALTEHLLQ